MSRRVFARFGEMVRFRIKLTCNILSANRESLTFCIAHFNSPEFLDATLHSIRRFHPESRVMVADASSAWREYVAAKSVCRRHRAELHPLAGKHRHTGLLNYMFRRIRSRVAVFLDQDCVLLARLDPLIQLVESGKISSARAMNFSPPIPIFARVIRRRPDIRSALGRNSSMPA